MTESLPTTPAPPPNRRRLQFSLRTLMVFVTVVAVGLAWFKRQLNKAETQRQTINNLLAVLPEGSDVRYHDYPRDSWLARWLPKWLDESLGHDFFFRVRRVTAIPETLKLAATLEGLSEIIVGESSEPVTDDHLRQIAAISSITDVEIHSTLCNITDEGLRALSGLSELQFLYLSRALNITDSGVRQLQHLAKLYAVRIAVCRLTDNSLKYLSQMSSITEIAVTSDELTDAGVTQVVDSRRAPTMMMLLLYSKQITKMPANLDKKMPRLFWFGIGTGLANQELTQLSFPKGLRGLDLSGNTALTDAGLEEICRFPFDEVHVSDTGLSDAGFEQLCGIQHLHWLTIVRTNVTQTSIIKMQKKYPQLVIRNIHK